MDAFLNRNDCLLMVVDIQDRLHVAMEEVLKDAYVKNGVILIQAARRMVVNL